MPKVYDIKRQVLTAVTRFCIGAICRGKKKFKSFNGARLCRECKNYNKTINDCEGSSSKVIYIRH